MADEAEDVLELDTAEVVIDEEDQEQQTGDEGEDGEPDFTFADEEGAAPAPDQDSSVIRDLRKRLREVERENAQHRKAKEPQIVDPGPKPTLADSNYDEEAFEARLTEWHEAGAKAAQQAKEAEERQQAVAREWEERAETYKSAKATIPGIDAAEETVKSVLSDAQFALLMKRKPEDAPKLIKALANAPGKLEELSKLDLAETALMIGELKGKLQMTTRKPSPDTPLRGNAGFSGGTDKQLARLEKEAERTGDRTALIRYRRSLEKAA